MNTNEESLTNAEGLESGGEIMVQGDSFTMNIAEHESHMGLDSEPSWIDLEFTISGEDGRTVEFVAMGSEVEEILKGINHALALKQEREEAIWRWDDRVDAIEELIQDYEDRLACELKNTVMQRYADLYDMTYDELMAEKEKMNAAGKADTPDE